MGIPRMIRECLNEMDNDDNQVVEKSVPMNAEQLKNFKEMSSLKQEANIAHQKAKRSRERFWGAAEEELGTYDKSMQISKDKKEIEILVDKD